jgi:hypothetical protein
MASMTRMGEGAEPAAMDGGPDQHQETQADERSAAIGRALHEAAAQAVADGLPLPAFMLAAQQAYLAASPALREELEAAQLIQHLERLRRVGRLGEA